MPVTHPTHFRSEPLVLRRSFHPPRTIHEPLETRSKCRQTRRRAGPLSFGYRSLDVDSFTLKVRELYRTRGRFSMVIKHGRLAGCPSPTRPTSDLSRLFYVARSTRRVRFTSRSKPAPSAVRRAAGPGRLASVIGRWTWIPSP